MERSRVNPVAPAPEKPLDYIWSSPMVSITKIGWEGNMGLDVFNAAEAQAPVVIRVDLSTVMLGALRFDGVELARFLSECQN